MNPVQFRNSSDYISAGAFGADYTGSTIDAGQFRKISMTVVNTATNTPVGNIYIQFSDNDSDWINGTGTATAAISGGETNLLYFDVNSRYVRFFWDYSSAGASSTVTVSYTLKS
jgi:hypothetical protein